MATIGVLLLNTGTPKKAEKKHVARYLHQFLMDPRVIDLPWIIRWPLVHGLIIPARLKSSTEAYQAIWTNGASPLSIHSQALKNALAEQLNSSDSTHRYVVELGMRYGEPSIPSAVEQLEKAQCDEWIILPLFPQYASASTGSAIEAVLKCMGWNIPSFQIKNHFYHYPGFINAYAKIISDTTSLNKPDSFLLFSYHGLPERHIEKSQCTHHNTCYQTEKSCPIASTNHPFCYRAQCFLTSKLLADKLALDPQHYATAFQSRLGKTPWIKPYSDHYLASLIQQGIKHLNVVCPSFVADCLETLEEIGIRLKSQWHTLGGESFTLIPCLNSHEMWVHSFAEYIRLLSEQ